MGGQKTYCLTIVSIFISIVVDRPTTAAVTGVLQTATLSTDRPPPSSDDDDMDEVESDVVVTSGCSDYDASHDPRHDSSRHYIRELIEDVDGDHVTVTIHYGQLRGLRIPGIAAAGGWHRTTDCFLGIPYARPPVGKLRFQRTRPPKPWNGVRDATKLGAVCPQPGFYSNYAWAADQDEDCLYLNVFAPPASPQERHPLRAVMVYIHGGSYRAGSGNVYVGHIIAQYDVVVVTINYRLGLLGFLSARNESLVGNYGLWDQIEALRWIQLNIRAFGGDPNRVTIFGNSAGGASVGILAVSPQADDLFAQAIVQSGSPLSFWAVHNDSVDLEAYVRLLATHLSCDRPHVQDMVNCLRTIHWRSLMSSVCALPRITPSGTDSRPVVDGVLLTDSPRSLLASGAMKLRPIMTGVVTEEWTRHLGMFLDDLYDNVPGLDVKYADGIDRETFERAVEHVMCTRFGYDRTIAKLVLHEYTSWHQRDDPFFQRKQYIHLITDMAMVAPTVELAEYYTCVDGPVYMYAFNHHKRPDPAIYQNWQSNYHEMELSYVFASPFTGISIDTTAPEGYAEVDQHLSRRMMLLWTNFAKYGNPTPEERENVTTWTDFRLATSDFLLIDSHSSSMRRHLRADKVDFWARLIPAIWSHQQQAVPLVGGVTRCPAPVIGVPLSAWITTGVVVVMVALLVTSTMLAVRYHSLYRNLRLSTSTPQDSAAKV